MNSTRAYRELQQEIGRHQRESSRSLLSLVVAMSAILLACGGLFLVGVAAAYAQPGPPPMRDRSAELASALKLNDKQAASVQGILKADQEAQMKLREEMRKKRDALDAATKAKLAKVLNAEQMGRYEEWVQANRPPRPDGPPRGEAGGRGPGSGASNRPDAPPKHRQ